MQSKNFMQMYFLNELKTDFMFGINIFQLAFWMWRNDNLFERRQSHFNFNYLLQP